MRLLEHDDWIRFPDRHVNFGSHDLDSLVLATQKPANMCGKESTLDIVWVSFGFRVFVVNAMIATPFVNIILESRDREPRLV